MVAMCNLEALIKFVEDFQELVSNRFEGNEKCVSSKDVKHTIRKFDVAFQNATNQKIPQEGKLSSNAELGFDLVPFKWSIVINRWI